MRGESLSESGLDSDGGGPTCDNQRQNAYSTYSPADEVTLAGRAGRSKVGDSGTSSTSMNCMGIEGRSGINHSVGMDLRS